MQEWELLTGSEWAWHDQKGFKNTVNALVGTVGVSFYQIQIL